VALAHGRAVAAVIETSLAPYLLWAKTRQPAAIDLAGSNLLPCAMEDLPGARDAVDLFAPNDNGYAPVMSAIAAHYGVSASRIVSGTGCSGVNFIAVAALVAPGDDVLIERPAYDPLIGACRLIGARVNRVDRRAEEGFAIDPDAVRRAMTPRTRLIIVTTPHNPSGVRIPLTALRELTAIAETFGAHLLVDEVYLEGACLVAGETLRDHSAALLDGPAIVTSSLTKSYGLAGLKSGWAIAPDAVAERMRRARDVIDNAGSGPSDRLAAHAWARIDALRERTRALLGRNVAAARAFFGAHPAFELPERPACSVVFPRVAGLPDADLFVQTLLGRGVAVAPGRFFEAPGHFRVSLAGATQVLEAGLARLAPPEVRA
jgi:aspartate/methionine/tyrosine aminotransferase